MFFPNQQLSSSSEEEREDARRRQYGDRMTMGMPPHPSPFGLRSKSDTTPMTAQMTPSPMRSPLIYDLSPIHPNSFSTIQQGYLEYLNQSISTPTVLFGNSPRDTPKKQRRKRSSRRSRLSDSLQLEVGNFGSKPPLISSSARRRSSGRKKRSPSDTSDTSPETSPSGSRTREDFFFPRTPSSGRLSTITDNSVKVKHNCFLQGTFVCMLILSSVGTLILTSSAVPYERPEVTLTAESGLRGKMVQGHWDAPKIKQAKKASHHDDKANLKEVMPSKKKKNKGESKSQLSSHAVLPSVQLPPAMKHEQKFDSQDPALYSLFATNKRRVVALDPSLPMPQHRKIKLYSADFTDYTQLYPVLDSSDERLSRMEIKAPYSTDECVPMQDWQTTFHPSCNEMHAVPLSDVGGDDGMDFNLFGTKGFWRNAWKVDFQQEDSVVLKTLKFEHNFEDAHFEHDRIDAVAMERLTSSKHVINIFGFCGHSVMTEYADGSRLGALVDKAKSKPLQRLRIARDIANGLADVHGIDGDDNATFVHLDINPANVVSIGGTLKLNDFNIGIIRQWNVTADKPCGFPAQYPNPQWRSPEEAREEQNLTEKVDVFSMGHIFFRMICGHEPWNKLEPGGRPTKEEVNEKVQKGVLPFIPASVMDTDDMEVIAIREAMLACYTFGPEDRPSARKVAKVLNKALQKLKKEQK